jgi:hypothetical protein
VVASGGVELQHAIVWLNVCSVEIDQAGLGGTMRVMASGAGGGVVNDVLLVILPACSLLADNHRTAVTFEAKVETGGVVGRKVDKQ